ncbi:hypothetical protein JXA88_11395 [Candidatus Fermentibacteria bacterium]|nr:hypothetical protein [Candidatus Fermentibacteria bacterium]
MRQVPDSLYRHLVPVLDLSVPDWQAVWQNILGIARAHGLGGVLLRRGRADEWRRVADEARTMCHPRPLLMADFEQGAASQVAGYRWLPKAFTVGATGSPGCARLMGETIAGHAKALGLDMILAPVADLLFSGTSSVIGTRSFGATPARVSAMVEAFVRGCQGEGIMAAAKHFPGHGRSQEDSHHHLPHLEVGYDEWMRSDAIPFEKAIGAGVGAVMVGHLWSESLDPGPRRPASLSPAILRVLLREELGFEGIILTDSLEMAGAGGNDTTVAAAALEAGADLVIGPDLGFGHSSGGVAVRDSETIGEGMGEEVLAREIAEHAVAWVGCKPPPMGSRIPASLRIVPDRAGECGWARPLQAALRQRDALHPAGMPLVAVSGVSATAAVLAAADEAKEPRGIAPVILACGALNAARCLAGRMSLILAGDATTASQEAAVRLLCGEIEACGRPDVPGLSALLDASPGDVHRVHWSP